MFDWHRHTEELVPVRVLETLPIDTLRRSGGLPSEVPFIFVSIRSYAYYLVILYKVLLAITCELFEIICTS